MEQRMLGKTGLLVSTLGFGGSEISHAPISTQDLGRLLGNALEAGITVVDTAECYAGSEAAIGEALGRHRPEFCLMTKCGHASGINQPDWSPALLEESIDRSLKRLRTDYVDVLFLHSCSVETLRDEKVMEVLVRARDAGKTRFVGYSGDSQAALSAVESGMFDVLMTSLNLADQEAVELTLPRAQARNMGVVVKRPIANVAWKTGQETAGEGTVRYWPRGYADTYADRLKRLDYEFLQQDDLQQAIATALRFTLSIPGVTTAIIGTTKPERLQQNAALLQAGPLDSAVVAAIHVRWQEVAEASWIGQG